MKKIFTVLTVALIVTFTANLCAAYDYDNDPNYVFVTTANGGIYLNLRTVNVHDYNPPHYQIAGWFVWTNGNKERQFEVVIRYNWNSKETFHREEGYWRKDIISDNIDSLGVRRNRQMADALFRAAYGMNFYGY